MGHANVQYKDIPISLATRKGGITSRKDGNREWVSVIACVSAARKVITPAVIFKGGSERVGENWVADLHEDDQYWVTATKKGWTSKEMGLKWLDDVFDLERPGIYQTTESGYS